MILPAPFGYETEYVTVTTVTGERITVATRQIPIRQPHEPVIPEWMVLLDVDSDLCLICGHNRQDEMHTLL